MYLDSAYIAKYYVNEPDAAAVPGLIERASEIRSSAWALVEVSCVFHRHARAGWLSSRQSRQLADLFLAHVEAGVWDLVPVTASTLRRTVALVRGLPPGLPIRPGDAIHLETARDLGETEIWTNDRHLLAAAEASGITGRSAGRAS